MLDAAADVVSGATRAAAAAECDLAVDDVDASHVDGDVFQRLTIRRG